MTIGVTGHQLIPRIALLTIREGIRNYLSGVPELHGACSLAAGADQIFAQEVTELGGSYSAVLPCKHYERTFGCARDLSNYKLLLAGATTIETLDFDSPSERSFLAAGQRIVDLSDELVAVWDGEPARGLGGTADIVAYARNAGLPVTVIWPKGLKR
jgi:hypothetical protein